MPEKYGNAQLIFTTIEGRILKTIDITKKGAGEITVASAPAIQITKGDALVIPHVAGAYSIGRANVVVSRPGNSGPPCR